MLITVNVVHRSAHRIAVMHACAPSMRSHAHLGARGVQRIALKRVDDRMLRMEHAAHVFIAHARHRSSTTHRPAPEIDHASPRHLHAHACIMSRTGTASSMRHGPCASPGCTMRFPRPPCSSATLSHVHVQVLRRSGHSATSLPSGSMRNSRPWSTTRAVPWWKTPACSNRIAITSCACSSRKPKRPSVPTRMRLTSGS
jgi:hypothetical protein